MVARHNVTPTLVFEWTSGGIAWDKHTRRWIVKGGRSFTFKQLKGKKTEKAAEKKCPRSPGKCEKLIETLLSPASNERRLNHGTWRPWHVHDFMVALWKMGFPREGRVFQLEQKECYELIESWVAPLPDWAKEQLDPATPPSGPTTPQLDSLDGLLSETHPHDTLTRALITRLRVPPAVVTIVAPPGAGKAGVVKDLIRHFEAAGTLRPIHMTCPLRLNEFFGLLANRLRPFYTVEQSDDAGSIAQELARSEGPRPLLILRSVNQYFGPSLEDSNHRKAVKNWLNGLQILRDLGGVSIVLTSTVPIAHQTDQYDDIAAELPSELFFAGAVSWDGWDEWLTRIRDQWEAAGGSMPQLPWDTLSARTRGQVRTLREYLQTSKRNQKSPPISDLDVGLQRSAQEILNQLPQCCSDALKAVVNGQSNGFPNCLIVLIAAGILRHETDERVVPALDTWATKWSQKLQVQ